MPFYEIELPLAGLDPDAVESALLELGALSITLLDRGDEPILEPKPGELRLWSDTLLRALFDQGSEPLSNLQRLAAKLGQAATADARIRRVEDQVWERVWLKDWSARRFGTRLWICPTDAPAPEAPQAVVVRLDPGLAFGTGSHATTALCLETLDSLPIYGRTVIDYGCGSGILGIAALKLGAAQVTAVDLDPQALLATRENARRNGVGQHLVAQDVAQELTPAFCVLANILAGPLIELAPTLRAACLVGGHLVLSGLLASQADQVKAAYAASFDMLRVTERAEWCCISARRVV
jgi:ribosomal protein L11 methyltransferase